VQLATKNTIHDLIRYFPSVIVPSLFGFLAVAFYTRLLSPREYGLYTLVFTTSLFVEILAFNWLNQSTLRYYERYKFAEVNDFFSTCLIGFFMIAAITTFILSSASIGLKNFFEPRLKELVLYLPILVLCQSGSKLMLIFLRARRESNRYSMQLSANSVIKLVCSLMFIYFLGMSAEAILLGICISGAYVFLCEFVRLARTWRPRIRHYNKDIFKKFARFGLPLLGLTFVNLILSLSDRYVIEILKDTAHVGIYSAAYKIAETGVFGIILFLMLASFPALIEVFENHGESEARALMRDLFGIFVIIMVPVVSCIVVLSVDIIEVTLGAAYHEAHLILPFIAVGIFFLGLCHYYGKSFELKEKTIFLPLVYSVPAALNLILNILLIPYIGIKGAAISTLVAYFCCFILLRIVGAKYIKWDYPWKTFLAAVLSSSIMGAILVLLPDHPIKWFALIYKISIGFMVYTIIIMIWDKKILLSGFEILKRKAPSA
jgi:O-antigen/teichoic acid export membrane protein